MIMVVSFLLLVCALSASSAAQETGAETATESNPESAVAAAQSETSGRTELNLLGRTDTASGESRRNENVQFNPIDNNALKELNERLGATATIVEEFRADRDYFGAEFGNDPPGSPHLAPPKTSGVHGQLRFSHNNSVFNARSFFQVGDVKPARENSYGFNLGVPVWRGAVLFIDAGQQKIRGNVNGNVLVPTADERTPLATDPKLRTLVERFLAAYPDELPNRTDINPRALNTNSMQRIDDDEAEMRLDQDLRDRDRLSMRYRFTSQQVDAFQLVSGQNPDTTTRAHAARITWNRQWTPGTLTNFTAGFNRIGSLLVPEENAVGPLVYIGRAIEMLGPTSSVPIDRAQNLFRYAGEASQIRGSHSWYAGFDLTRRQLNGTETSSHRGTVAFHNAFGRDAITNFRLGTPTAFMGAIGHVHRGFRRWEMGYFAGDNWRVNSGLTLSFGLRYEPVTRPREVNGLNVVPFDCDCNNLAPRFGFAYRLPGQWGVLRGAYGLHFGQIFPVTFGQVRYNPPLNNKFVAIAPDMRIPVEELLETGVDPATRSSLVEMAPELAVPYSHQYNFSWEPFAAARWSLQLGYVGSRSHKLLATRTTNRARVVEGIDQTTETQDERRPNQNYSEIRTVLNGSRAYFDAARVSLIIPRWQGFSVDASYWFSKAIDLGANYLSTGAGMDAYESRGQSEFFVHDDVRGLAGFDQPHSFLLRTAYELPAPSGARGWAAHIFRGWRIAAVALLKSGTPFSIGSGSDAPGYGNVDGSFGDRPHVVDPSVLGRTIGNPDTSRQLLPRTAFAYMEPTELRGNIGRNTFRKGDIANVNAMLARTFNAGGERQLTFRAESINFFNTPQFSNPGQYLTNPDFAHITNTLNDGRAFRVLLELNF